jgi:hypothetical protein
MYCERAQTPYGVSQGIWRTSALKIKLFVGFDHKRDGVWPSVKRAIGLVTYLGLAMQRSLVRHHQLNGLWSV